jgi:hypothetical protein
MLVATEALRPPKLRVGKIGQNFTLPRTVPAAALVVGSLLALVFVGLFGALVGYSVQSVMYSAVVGASLGVLLVSYSPMQGESLARWMGLKIKSRGKRPRLVNGQSVRLAIGICYIETPVSGYVQVAPGAIPIRPGSFDDRGVRLEERRWRSTELAPVTAAERFDVAWRDDDAPVRPKQATPADAMAAFRAASSVSELEDFVPNHLPPIRPIRRHGRWEQDPETLASLYLHQRFYVTDDEPDDEDVEAGDVSGTEGFDAGDASDADVGSPPLDI